MTYLYSRKAYQEDMEFAEIVESTAEKANNLTHHIQLIQEHYPNLTVVQLWTFEHSGMSIDTFKRCQWDSSADAFGCYDNRLEFEEKLEEINSTLM